MKKTKKILGLMFLFFALLGTSGCSKIKYKSGYYSDETGHYQEARIGKGHTELEAHEFGEAEITREPTCSKEGIKVYTCSVCGYQKQETIEKLDHTYGEPTIKDSTCTSQGKRVYTCTVCGESKEEAIDYKEHTYNQEVTDSKYLKEAANCLHGAIYYKSCSCGLASTTETFEYGEANAHNYDREVEGATYLKEAATCTHGTLYYKSCECGATSTTASTFEKDDKLQHTPGTYVYDSEHDYHKTNCTACGTELTGECTYGNYVVQYNETTQKYEAIKECSVCGHQVKEETYTLTQAYNAALTSATAVSGNVEMVVIGYSNYGTIGSTDAYAIIKDTSTDQFCLATGLDQETYPVGSRLFGYGNAKVDDYHKVVFEVKYASKTLTAMSASEYKFSESFISNATKVSSNTLASTGLSNLVANDNENVYQAFNFVKTETGANLVATIYESKDGDTVKDRAYRLYFSDSAKASALAVDSNTDNTKYYYTIRENTTTGANIVSLSDIFEDVTIVENVTTKKATKGFIALNLGYDTTNSSSAAVNLFIIDYYDTDVFYCEVEDTENHTPHYNKTEIYAAPINPVKHYQSSLTKIEATDSTCTTAGNKTYYHCDICDQYFDSSYNIVTPDEEAKELNEDEHEYSEWTIETIPTETTTGKATRTRSCSSDHGDGEILIVETHSVTLPVLTNSKYTKTIKTEVSATTDEVYTYSITIDEDYPVVTFDVTTVESCKGTHVYDQEVVDEQYLKSEATCTSKAVYYKSCVCGEASTTETFEYGKVAEHTYGESTLVSKATCTSQAKYKHTCTVCGHEEEYEDGELADHDYDDWSTKTEANCGSAAIEHRTCTECGHEETRTKEDSTPTGSHNYGEATLVSAATCTAKAKYKHTCTVCGHEETYEDEDGELAEHTYSEWIEVSEATCKDQAVHKKVCSVCGHEETESYGDKADHNLVCVVDEAYFIDPSTGTEHAKYCKSCSWCGERFDEYSFDEPCEEYYSSWVFDPETKSASRVCSICNHKDIINITDFSEISDTAGSLSITETVIIGYSYYGTTTSTNYYLLVKDCVEGKDGIVLVNVVDEENKHVNVDKEIYSVGTLIVTFGTYDIDEYGKYVYTAKEIITAGTLTKEEYAFSASFLNDATKVKYNSGLEALCTDSATNVYKPYILTKGTYTAKADYYNKYTFRIHYGSKAYTATSQKPEDQINSGYYITIRNQQLLDSGLSINTLFDTRVANPDDTFDFGFSADTYDIVVINLGCDQSGSSSAAQNLYVVDYYERGAYQLDTSATGKPHYLETIINNYKIDYHRHYKTLPSGNPNNDVKITKHTAVAATCVAAGNIEYWVCPTCGTYFKGDYVVTDADSVVVALDSTAHKYEEDWTIVEPTSTATGTATKHCEHASSDATHDNVVTLPVLTETDKYTITHPTLPTCESTGTDHYVLNEDTTIAFDVTVAALGHDYGEWDIDEPTTENEGSATKVCSHDTNSDHKIETTLPVLTETNKYTIKHTTLPTCEEAGVDTYTLKSDTTISFTVAVDKLVHTSTTDTASSTLVHYSAVEPSADNDQTGNYEYWKCSVCNKYYMIDEEFTEVTEAQTIHSTKHIHNYTEVSVSVKPTSDDAGLAYVACSADGCDDPVSKVEVVLPKLDETNYSSEVTTEPTCYSVGTRTYTYKYTNTKEKISNLEITFTYDIDMVAHTYAADGYSVTTAPTTSSEGVATATCTVSGCNHQNEVTLPKLSNKDYTVTDVTQVCTGDNASHADFTYTIDDTHSVTINDATIANNGHLDYKLVTNVSELAAGDKIIIVAGHDDVAGTTTNYGSATSKVVAASAYNYVSSTGIEVFTLVTGSTTGTFNLKYTTLSSSKTAYVNITDKQVDGTNTAGFGNTTNSLTVNADFSITISDGLAIICNKSAGKVGYLGYKDGLFMRLQASEETSAKELRIYKLTTETVHGVEVHKCDSCNKYYNMSGAEVELGYFRALSTDTFTLNDKIVLVLGDLSKAAYSGESSSGTSAEGFTISSTDNTVLSVTNENRVYTLISSSVDSYTSSSGYYKLKTTSDLYIGGTTGASVGYGTASTKSNAATYVFSISVNSSGYGVITAGSTITIKNVNSKIQRASASAEDAGFYIYLYSVRVVTTA